METDQQHERRPSHDEGQLAPVQVGAQGEADEDPDVTEDFEHGAQAAPDVGTRYLANVDLSTNSR